MKKLLLFLILVGFFIWTLFPREPGVEISKEFLIEKGDSIWEIASNLEKEDLVKNRFSFILYLFLKGRIRDVKAGYYLLPPSLSVFEITKKLIEGETIKEKITIIEGWSKKDIASYIEEKNVCSEAEFLKTIKLENWKEDYDFFKEDIVTEDIEGYLFPDTYFVEKKVSCEQLVSQMLENFDEKLDFEMKREIFAQKKKIFEIVTMGSLIEKEVKTLEEKKLVSGILWKRLENDIPLQIDATISFITGKKTTKVSKEETEIDSPYNTYKYKNLPKGPICNPGLESIKAAIYPQDSEYWYYLSTPSGETIFSKTLKEHNIAKAKFLK